MMKFVHFELTQESKCKCSATANGSENIKPASRFMRLSCDCFLNLEVSKLEELLKLCDAAHDFEEFFLTADSTDQWLRTLVGHEDYPPKTWTKLDSKTWGIIGKKIYTSFRGTTWKEVMIPNISFHSNILPYDPDWSKLRSTTDDAFPFRLLEEALHEKKTLKSKLTEWIRKRTSKGSSICDNCGKPRFHSTLQFRKIEAAQVSSEPPGPGSMLNGKFQAAVEVNSERPPRSMLFREIQAADVQLEHQIAESISLVTWKKGKFIQKNYVSSWESLFTAELEILERLCHPNIVFSFGTLSEDGKSSYFMEYMSQDLMSLILERTRRTHRHNLPPFPPRVRHNLPPFSPRDSVDILLQVAKAMRYMHHQASASVVHCDLKSANILMSKVQVSPTVEHYVAKVADFGSARIGNAGGFQPGPGTTEYSAPEALKYFKQKRSVDLPAHLDLPHKIDVYSFGVVAFEVITGEIASQCWPKGFKVEVMKGSWKPPLRQKCEESDEAFIRDEELISLIERCWLYEPSERPSFEQICLGLDRAKDRLVPEPKKPFQLFLDRQGVNTFQLIST